MGSFECPLHFGNYYSKQFVNVPLYTLARLVPVYVCFQFVRWRRMCLLLHVVNLVNSTADGSYTPLALTLNLTKKQKKNTSILQTIGLFKE